MNTASIALIMEVVSTSETSVNFYRTTWNKIPEDNQFHTRRRENLRSHQNQPLYSRIAVNETIFSEILREIKKGVIFYFIYLAVCCFSRLLGKNSIPRG
jgi:hypothetical protein